LRKTRFFAASAIGLVAAITMTACAGGVAPGGSTTPQVVPTPQAAGKSITVWNMNGDLTAETLATINAKFTELTGATVVLQEQQWDNIITKVTTALATSTPPDVIDLGNTQVPGYAANGGLLDLTPYKEDLQQGQTWLGGLEDPATINGSLYGVPSFAGANAVLYNKEIWTAAGVTAAPTTYEELTADLDKIKAANPAEDFSAFYYPGQQFYAAMSFVWDAGGDIATDDNGVWKAGFSSAESQQGLNDFKEFQNTYSSTASQTLDFDKPPQNQVFAEGKSSAYMVGSYDILTVQQLNPAMTDETLGTFPFPGKSGELQPQLLVGSVWGIAAKSTNKDLALLWTKIASSPEIQNANVFGNDGWIPNSVEGVEAAQSSGQLSDLTTSFFTAALNSRSTPAAANWPTIEVDRSVFQFFSSVASGAKSPKDAAAEIDAHIDSVLNGG
jgi:N,N'-diacetylchitobiose transport system substrate-binding protein